MLFACGDVVEQVGEPTTAAQPASPPKSGEQVAAQVTATLLPTSTIIQIRPPNTPSPPPTPGPRKMLKPKDSHYSPDFRGIRGGGWFDEAEFVLSTNRNGGDPKITANDDIGFRCAK
jgi:hypothetical protein